MMTLNEISRVVSSTLDLGTLYETIYTQVKRVMDAGLFFVAVDSPGRRIVVVPYMREHDTLLPPQDLPPGESVTTLVIATGQALLFHTDRQYREYVRANNLPELSAGDAASESMIFVPLNTGNRTIGVLSVQSGKPNAYSQVDVQTLSVIAAQAAVAIENARLYQQSQDAVRQMQALLHVAQMVSGSLHVQTVLDSILVGIREVLPYHVASILLPASRQQALKVAAARGPQAASHESEGNLSERIVPTGSGIIGSVFSSGEPLYIADTRTVPDHVSFTSQRSLSEMAVPLKRGDTVVGVVHVERQGPNAFTSQELDLLTLFASQAAIAIENARLFSNQQDRVFELQAIQTIVQRLTPLHDIHSIANLINRELAGLIDYHSCRLFVLDQMENALLPVSLAEFDPHGLRVEVGQGITGWIAEHGRPQIVDNMLDDPRHVHIEGTEIRAESMIGAPLIYEGRVQGVITLSKLGTKQFDENSLRLLEIIAAQTALAFDRARLYEELRLEAVTDELTQLYNRRYLMERFREEKSRAARNKYTLVVLMLDIDKFKRVNDSHGHDAGDIVLRDLAALVRKVVRAGDIVARYGGEEFCILLPEIAVPEAEHVAERLRLLIEKRTLPDGAGVERITVSVGMAVLSADDRDLEVFSRADLAMYQVKNQGGNRVCIYDGSEFFWYGPKGTPSAQ
jgi:diguanylate cyclase (GGDEF)-like protein